MHSEVKCNVCRDRWLWGLSWDGSMDGKFICSNCASSHDCKGQDGCNAPEHQSKIEQENED